MKERKTKLFIKAKRRLGNMNVNKFVTLLAFTKKQVNINENIINYNVLKI